MSKPLCKMIEDIATANMPELNLGEVAAGAKKMNWKPSLSVVTLLQSEMQLLENYRNLEDHTIPPTPPNSPQGILYRFNQIGLQSLNSVPYIKIPNMVKNILS